MKTFLSSLALLAGLAAVIAAPASAQTALVQTSLSSAITNSQTTIPVASATGISAQTTSGYTELYMDKEAMLVVGVNGLSISVVRGVEGTGSAAHVSGSLVFVAPGGALSPGGDPSGSCSANPGLYTPRIVPQTGNVWVCNSQGQWGASFLAFGRADLGIGNYTAVADAAYTAKFTDTTIAYQTLTATRAVTLPAAAGLAGHVIVIKDEAGTAATNNITVATTVDGSTSTFKVAANYGSIRCYSNGTAWFSF